MYIVNVRKNQALWVCVTTPIQSTFWGYVCKYFVGKGHHNG